MRLRDVAALLCLFMIPALGVAILYVGTTAR